MDLRYYVAFYSGDMMNHKILLYSIFRWTLFCEADIYIHEEIY